MRDCRSSEEHFSFLLQIAYETGLCPESRVRRNLQPVRDACLSCEDAMLTDLRRTGDSYHRAHNRVLADLHVMCNLAEIVNLYAFMYDG